MKTISIRDLHEKTGEWVRRAGKHGEILVTNRGRTIAKILPETGPKETPYFARRVISPSFRRLMNRGRLRGGTDSTHVIAESRERLIR